MKDCLAGKEKVFIEDVLDEHDVLLLDTCAVAPSYLVDYLSEHRIYDGLDHDVLQTEEKANSLFCKLIIHPGTMIIPEVVSEMRDNLQCLRNINLRLSQNSGFNSHTTSNDGVASKNKRIIEKIINDFQTALADIPGGEIFDDYEPFQILYEMITRTSKHLHLKHDTGLKYGKLKPTTTTTDEKIVAASYYVSTNSLRPAIITMDWDIVNLLGGTRFFFRKKDLSPHNEGLVRQLSQNPVVCYFIDPENIGWMYKLRYKDCEINLLSFHPQIRKAPVLDLARQIGLLMQGYNERAKERA